MTQKAYNELESIKNDLSSIINEIEDIADSVGQKMRGLGEDKCAKSLRSVADKYRKVKKSLNNIDTSKVNKD